MTHPTIYKILTAPQFASFQRESLSHGSPADLADGFIHLSTATQLRGTIEKHFATQPGLFLLAVNTALLGESLRWEVSRGGALFPHLYAPLNASSVTASFPLEFTPEGEVKLPA